VSTWFVAHAGLEPAASSSQN